MELDINLSFGTLDKSDYDSYSQYLSLVTEEQLKEKDIYIFGAFNDDDDELIGVAVFRSANPADLLSITVAERYRNRGVGSAMIIHMIEALSGAGIEGINCIIPEDKGGTVTGPGLFFWRCGFSPVGKFSDFSFSLSSAKKNEKLAPIIEKWTGNDYEAAPKPHCSEGKSLLKLLPSSLNGDDVDYSPSVSTVYKKSGSPAGCLLVSKEDGFFLVNALYATVGQPKVLYSMIVRTLMAIAEIYDDETELRFVAAFDQLEDLYSFMFPEESGSGFQTIYALPFRRSSSNKAVNNGDADTSRESLSSEDDKERQETDADTIVLPEDDYDDDPKPEDNEEGGDDGDYVSHFADDPVFRPVTDDQLYCKYCLYRLGGMESGACHKYDIKPDNILNGGICDKFYAERRK